MAADQTPDDPKDYPVLARLFLWVDRPNGHKIAFRVMVVICALTLIAELFYKKHPHFEMGKIPGFYGIYGFLAFTIVILGAKALRVLIKRNEDYYGDLTVNSEDYPEEGTDKVDYHV